MSPSKQRRRPFLSIPRDFLHRRRFRRRLTDVILIPLLSVIVGYIITRPTGGTGFTLPRVVQQASLSGPAHQDSPAPRTKATSVNGAVREAAAASGAPAPGAMTAPLLGGGYMLDDGPHVVAGIRNVVLHDAKRNRNLHIRIFYPQEPGPYPVIVFSADPGGSRFCCDALTRHWAGYGYVSLQLTDAEPTPRPRSANEENVSYLKEDRSTLNETASWQSSPGEISFVLDSLATLENRFPALAGKIDSDHIGVGGHSMGAFAADALAGALLDLPGRRGASFADPRVQAVLLLSPPGPGEFGLTARSWDHVTVPLLSITGSLDLGDGKQSPQWREIPFERSQPGDKYQVFIQGAGHLSFISAKTFSSGRVRHSEPILGYTNSAALAFWDAYLKGDLKAKLYLQSSALPDFSNGAVKLARR